MNSRIKVLVWLITLLCVVHLVNIFLGGALLRFGILPLHSDTLPFIFTAPFIHGDWPHLLNNLFGLTLFSALCLLRGTTFYFKASLTIITLTGAMVWLFGRQAIHIGASGWIFGLWSLSIAIAWFDRKFANIAIAIFVLFFYGGMIVGVLPSDPHVSFESHLFGAVAGVICAYSLTRPRKRRSR